MTLADPEAARLDVIVADDDPSTRHALQAAVMLLGHTCRVAADGEEAWRLHREKAADVILSDWRMPVMDGVELCRRVRASDEMDDTYTYFIFLTSFDDKEHLLQGMEAGADDYHAKPVDIDELHARLVTAQRVITLHRRLAARSSRLRRDSESSFRAARVDALTELGNRLRMTEDVEQLWSRWTRYGHSFCVAMCDVDWFKVYNDEFGHIAGDVVLRRVARTLRSNIRQSDSVYRYGGEEFVVILPEQSLAEAALAVDRMRRDIENLGVRATTSYGAVTISAGIAQVDLSDSSFESCLERADAALYRAKSRGRNRVEIASPAMADSSSMATR